MIIAERKRVDVVITIALVEQRIFFRGVPGTAYAAAHEQQVPFPGRHRRVIPIDDGERVVLAYQQVARMEIGMADHELDFTFPQHRGKPAGALDDETNLLPPVGPESGKLCSYW